MIRGTAWMEHALCLQVGPEVFFPEPGDSVKAAKRVCARCPVMDACLAYALADPTLTGIWGGTSERQRRELRRTGRRAA